MAKLSAVEFVLCVLSMFGRVIDENRMAVQVLLLAIKSYNPMTGQFGKLAVKQAGHGGRSSLRALAAYLGKDYMIKALRTEQGAQAVLHTILDPVIGSLSRQELAKLRKDMDEAMRLASSAPMEEVQERMAGFVLKAWKDGRREHWMGVWKQGLEAHAAKPTGTAGQCEDLSNCHDSPSISAPVELATTNSTGAIAIVPVTSTLKRCARVPVSRRCGSFPNPVDICLGRNSSSSPASSSSSSSSGEWWKDDGLVWHCHGRRVYLAPAVNQKALAMDFRFPPPGMTSTTPTTVTSVMTSPVDPAPDMSVKFRKWENEWERHQLGTWKAAIGMDSALRFIVECTRNMKISHAHGWKKFDGNAQSAHKNTGFRFPATGSVRLPSKSTATSPVDSDRSYNVDADAKYRKWEDSWMAEQLGRWSTGLKMRPRKEQGAIWSRLATAWKSSGVDVWAGMMEDEDEVDMRSLESTATSVTRKLGQLLGLA